MRSGRFADFHRFVTRIFLSLHVDDIFFQRDSASSLLDMDLGGSNTCSKSSTGVSVLFSLPLGSFGCCLLEAAAAADPSKRRCSHGVHDV